MKHIAVLCHRLADFEQFARHLPDAVLMRGRGVINTKDAKYSRVTMPEDIFGAEFDGIERLGAWYLLPDAGRLEEAVMARIRPRSPV